MNWHLLPDSDYHITTFKTTKTLEGPAKEISRVLNLVVNNKRIEPYKPPQIRTSKLPICGLLHTLEILEKEDKEVDYSQDFFTNIGTAVHDTLQTHFPLTKDVWKYVFGDWKCTNPGCRKHNKIVKYRCTTPVKLKCPKCKKRSLKYSEIETNYKDEIGGHVDLILLIKGKYYLIDFKTTSESNVQSPDKYLPYPKHRMQIEGYIIVLKEEFDIEVSDYFLIYISRNSTDMKIAKKKPNSAVLGFKVTPRLYTRRKKHLDAVVRQAKLSKKLLTTPSTATLKQLNDARPCHSLEDYENKYTGMKHAFFANDDCIYFKGGSCFKDKKYTTPAKHIWQMLKEQMK